MAYYGQITDMTRPRRDVVMIHFTIYDDAPEPDEVILSGTMGFPVVIYNPDGTVVTETLVQKRARMKAAYDAYVTRIIEQMQGGDTAFEAMRSQALGYRYPPAS